MEELDSFCLGFFYLKVPLYHLSYVKYWPTGHSVIHPAWWLLL